MRVTVVIFTYEVERLLIPETIKSLNQLFPKYPGFTFRIVLVDDGNNPLPPKLCTRLGVERITTTGNRNGNLRSWNWIREQVRVLVQLDTDIVIKLDPDCLVLDLEPFLEPYTRNHKGMIGFTGHKESVQNHSIGACYSMHMDGLRLLHSDIEQMWNTEWMDVMCSYLLTFLPSAGICLPACEDIVISMWFHHRQGLILLPADTFSVYNWDGSHRVESAALVFLGNPGPVTPDKHERRALVAAEFQKIIPIPRKKR